MKHLIAISKITAIVLGYTLVSMAFSSCKKNDKGEDGAGVYGMKFKVNGSQVVFNVQGSLVAAFAQAGTVFNGVFTGSDNVSSISLQVYDSKTISETTYSGYKLVGSSFVGALISYNDAAGTGYSQGSGSPVVSVTISEITATTVRGTFTGTLKSAGKPDINITEGEFFVWRAN